MPKVNPTLESVSAAERSGTLLQSAVLSQSRRESMSPALSGEGPTEEWTSLASRLQRERAKFFSGRESEIAAVLGYVEDLSCSLISVTGQVGVGKTALLRQVQERLERLSYRVAFADAEALFQWGARVASEFVRMASEPSLDPSGVLSTRRCVLFLDGVEKLSESEVRTLLDFCGALPESALLVVASRVEPPYQFSADPAWSALSRSVRLRPLSDRESCDLLAGLGVAEGAQAAICSFSGGFPLALVTAAEVLNRRQAENFDADALVDVQHILSRLLGADSLPLGQRFALEVLSIARVTTAELVDQMGLMFGATGPGLEDVYHGLSQRPFVDSTPHGLIPHALVRATLRAQFRRERPRRYQAMQQAIREWHVASFETSPTPASDYLSIAFLDREAPAVRSWAELSGWTPGCRLRRASISEHRAVVDLILRHEGPGGARLVQKQLESEAHRFEVNDGPRAEPLSLLSHYLHLTPETAAQCLSDGDAATQIVREALARQPLEKDEETYFFRWWLHKDAYQSPSLEVLPVIALQTQLVLSSGRVGRSYCVYRDPSEWEASWNDTRVAWHSEGAFYQDGREYHVLLFDFRRRPVREILLDPWANSVRQRHSWALLNDGRSSRSSQGLPPVDQLRRAVQERVGKLSRDLRLTPRETEILEQLCLGESTEKISSLLSIRPRTVKFHQENLLRKLGVASRAEIFRKLF